MPSAPHAGSPPNQILEAFRRFDRELVTDISLQEVGYLFAVAEITLLSAARRAAMEDTDALLIADGLSCRTQTENLIGLRPLSLAQVPAATTGASDHH